MILAVVSLLGIRRKQEEDRTKKKIENKFSTALDLGIMNLNIGSSDFGEEKYDAIGGVVNKSLSKEQAFSFVHLKREECMEESHYPLSEEAGAQLSTCDASETGMEENSENDNLAVSKQQEDAEKGMLNDLKSEEQAKIVAESSPHSRNIHEGAEAPKAAIVNPSYQDNEASYEYGSDAFNFHDDVPSDP